MDRDGFRWVGLTRVSTSGQADDGGGLETQQAAIEEFCRKREERLVKVLSDAGVSGLSAALADRIALAEALQMLNANEADGIVVAKLDRLGRDLFIQEKVLHEVRLMGCVVASCDVTELDALLNDDDPIRKMTRQILAVVAEYERSMIVARIQAGKNRKHAEIARRAGGQGLTGGWMGAGHPPYGYELDGRGGLREVPHELEAIAQARTMRKAGATYKVCAEMFASSGVRLRKATKWHPEVVRCVLMKAQAADYPKSQPLNNLAKLIMGLPTDANAV